MYTFIEEAIVSIFKFIKNNDGVTAIEFAFFAIPMAFIIAGMVEVGMMSTAGTLLQGATDDAARLIRTGQAQTSADPQGMFEDMLCDKVDLLIDCDDLVYEVIKIDEGTGFGGLAANMMLIEPVFDPDGNLVAQGFDAGNENSLIIVRVTYNYPLLSPFVGPVMSDNNNNTRLLMATAIIQNEPYQF